MSSVYQSTATNQSLATLHVSKDNYCFRPNYPPSTKISRSALIDILKDTHCMYPMECEQRPNILSRVLLCIFELEGDKDQAVNAYQQLVSSLHLLRPVSISVDVHQGNWKQHFGDTNCYQSYLTFFDSEIKQHGLSFVLTQYLNAMPPSIHSQLQPLVHIAFGLEHDLPLMVSEGLAYLASTLDDASNWILPTGNSNASTNNSSKTPPRCSFDYLLFECIQSDPRFNGVMEGGRPVAAKIKLLLKNHGPLLQNYLQQWLESSSLQPLEQQMDELIDVTLRMMETKLLDEPTHQLLASILALRTLYTIWSPEVLSQWIQVQGLLMICTFIVQGRPHNTKMNTLGVANTAAVDRTAQPVLFLQHQDDWSRCISSFISAGPPPCLILTMRSLYKAQQRMPRPSSCLRLANTLVASLNEDL